MSIPGASVVEKGTINGTVTDMDGNFTLTVSGPNAVLVVSFIGYKTPEITPLTKIKIVLREDVEQLDEVVITGYGGQQKRATLTTAISKMDNAVLDKAAFSNAAQALQGTVTGMRVVTTSGQPGSEPNITLRGGATITGANNKALIIVDGVIRDSMSDINPSDIESIQVLKDAASTGKGSTETKWIAGRQEGGKLGEMVGYKQNHVFKDWDDVKAYADRVIDEVANLYGPGLAAQYEGKEGWKPIQPGDVCWEDINGDDIINGLDREVIGNIFPKVTGGFSTTLTWKDLSLYARFDYAIGHTLYNDLAARNLGQYQDSFNLISEVHDMWSETNTDTDLPAFYYADQLAKKNITRSNSAGLNRDNNSSHFYEKADYMALRELTLNYNLPKKWIGKAFIRNASVYVTGQNLFYITGYTGTSAEQNRLLWPIDANMLTNHPDLDQTPGY